MTRASRPPIWAAKFSEMDTRKRILIINPNTTASMTEKIRIAALGVCPDDFDLEAINPAEGPASIEGYYDEARSLAGLLDTMEQQPDADGYIIACFDDTGLDAARCLTDAPVIGIGEAAYHLASIIAERFTVVTTLPRSIGALEHNLARYGLAARCAAVRASDVPVLDLETGDSGARAKLEHTIEQALEADQSGAIVLGCAGMADLVSELEQKFQVPIVDGVAAAVGLMQGMLRMGLKTGRTGGYAPPRKK